MSKCTHVSKLIQEPLLNCIVIEDPTDLFYDKKEQAVVKIAHFLWKQFRWQKLLSYPREYLAKVAGCDKRTVTRSIKWLEAKGILNVLRGKKEVNTYSLVSIYRESKTFTKFLNYFTGWCIFSLALLVPEPDVTLKYLNDILIKNKSVPVLLHSGNSLMRTRTGNWFFIKREIMSLDHCRALKQLYDAGLPLTDHGIAKLAAYPAKALEYGVTQVSKIPDTVKDPFAYFITILQRYCNVIQQFPNWSTYFQLKRGLNIEEQDECYLDETKWRELLASRKSSSKPNNEEPKTIKGKSASSSLYAPVNVRVRETNELIKAMEEKRASLSTEEVAAPVALENDRQKKYQEELLKMLGLQ